MGHAVPMPVVVKTREYGEQVYAEFAQSGSPTDRHEQNKRLLGHDDNDSLID
jgi:hypothetical protein